MVEVYKPITTEEAINNLQQFLECDLYSKLKPIELLPDGSEWVREDLINNKEEFYKYLQDHFDILRKQIKEINLNGKIKNRSS